MRGVADWYIGLAHEDKHGCLIHEAQARNGGGVGTVYFEGRVVSLCRIIIESHWGSSPDPSFDASHTCLRGQQGCINPMHLVWESRSNNKKRG